MADASLHFAAGLALGMALATPRLRQAWSQRHVLAPAMLRGMTLSWGLGLWAVTPSLLRYAGMPDAFCQGWWMNLFLLHPLINRWGPHATIIGAVALVSCIAFQYGTILAGILRARMRPTPASRAGV